MRLLAEPLRTWDINGPAYYPYPWVAAGLKDSSEKLTGEWNADVSIKLAASW